MPRTSSSNSRGEFGEAIDALYRFRYGLTTLSQRRCSPQRLLRYIRAHWKVENHLHWRRDALLGEDRCRVRCVWSIEMLAVLNTVVLSLMQLHQVSTVAKQLRRFAFHPEEALPWLYQDFLRNPVTALSNP